MTDEVYSSPLKAVLATLYQQSAADKLNEYTYDANLADMSYDLQVLPRGVRLTFGGYNEKLGAFASYVSTKLARDLEDVLPRDEDEFERYKDNLQRALSAFKVQVGAGVDFELLRHSLTFECRNPKLPATLRTRHRIRFNHSATSQLQIHKRRAN